MTFSQWYFRYDSIFLIIDGRNSNSESRYKIFGISETNSAPQLKSYGNFGSLTSPVRFRFPQVITPMNNGKYLFYPQYIDLPLRYEEKVCKSFVVEEWHYNDGLIRSPINFPVNFTDEEWNLWIFKTWMLLCPKWQE